MIAVSTVFDKSGVLVECSVNGHAGAAEKGADIVCAAASVLVRALARSVSGREGIFARVSAPGRGRFEFSASYNDEARGFLFAAGVFLFEGIKSLTEEFPEYCSLNSSVKAEICKI